jgi:hypothetical protein
MHDSLYREFDIDIRAETSALSPDAADMAAPSSLLARLTHRPSGESKVVRLTGVLSGMDCLLEMHVCRLFPHTGTARQLEQRAGSQGRRLNANWRTALARKVNLALMGLCDSPAATFWWHHLQAMPRVVVLMMYRRTEARFEQLEATCSPNLAQFGEAIRLSWSEVLVEAAGLDSGWRDLKLTELHRKGWPVELLEPRTREQLAAIARYARTGHMALGYLSDQDWRCMLGFVLEPSAAHPRALPETATC